MENPYLILGVSRDAPDYVIQAAYRACLKRYHPDQYRGSDAAARTTQIVAAYELLRDPGKRSAVDERLNRASHSHAKTPPPPAPPPRSQPKSKQPDESPVLPQKRAIWPTFAALATLVTVISVLSNNEQTDATDASILAYDSGAADADTVEIPANDVLLQSDNVAIAAEEAAKAADEAASEIEFGAPSGFGYQPEPVSFSTIEAASRRFFTVFQKEGMIGARRASERCHQQQAESPTWQGLDACAAFDFAADMMDRGFTSSSGASRNAYFEFQAANQSDYYSGRQTYTRLNSIRNASQTALSEAMQRYLSRQQRARESAIDKERAKATEAEANSVDLNGDLGIDHSRELAPN